MGWLGSLFGQRSEPTDPLASLDPKLRAFLEKESPVKYQQRPQQQHNEVAPPPASEPTSLAAAVDQDVKPGVPRESLYQDGRYAHLWKTYRPQAEIDTEGKSEHEKLMDVLDAYKERKAQIGRAALENCALEQLDWRNCMRAGDLAARMTMCHTQVRKFERCYTVQSVRFFFHCFFSPLVDLHRKSWCADTNASFLLG